MMRIVLVLWCMAFGSGTCLAQVYPSKTVRIVLGVAAGGLSDTLARGLAQELTRSWGQSLIIENRTGASDIIATDMVAKSAPDGYNILQTSIVTWLTNQFLRRSLPYDPDRDLTPVLGLARTTDILIAKPLLPASNVQELVALAKARPGALNYGSFGVGSALHLDALALSQAAQIDITHVPYKGGAEIMRALLSGEIDFAFTGVTAAIPLIRQGQLKALAYGGPQRSAVLPQVPTLAESGYSFETGSWLAWFVPAATPRAIVDKISADASRVLATPAFRDQFIRGGGLDELDLQAGPARALLKDNRDQFNARYGALKLRLD